MDSRLGNQVVNEFIFTSVFSVSYLLYPRHFPSLWSCHGVYFQIFLVLLLRYIALSLCYIGDLCYQILDPILDASYLKLKVWLSPAIVHILYVVDTAVHMNLSSIAKCPHWRQPHGTVWTFFSRLTAMSRKNRRKHRKVGNSVGTCVCLFSVPWKVAMSPLQELYLEFNVFREYNWWRIFS